MSASASSSTSPSFQPVFCNTCEKQEGDKERFKTCGGCISRNYCSEDCQKEDWETHQKVCHLLANIQFFHANLKPIADSSDVAYVSIALSIGLVDGEQAIAACHKLARQEMKKMDWSTDPKKAATDDFHNKMQTSENSINKLRQLAKHNPYDVEGMISGMRLNCLLYASRLGCVDVSSLKTKYPSVFKTL